MLDTIWHKSKYLYVQRMADWLDIYQHRAWSKGQQNFILYILERNAYSVFKDLHNYL